MADTDHIQIDFREVLKGLKGLKSATIGGARRGLQDAGEDLLRLSLSEVPHDKGWLQQTGTVDISALQTDAPEVVVGYNTPYAARLHEHPEYTFQKGRKGKYLEDPLLRNLASFLGYIQAKINEAL